MSQAKCPLCGASVEVGEAHAGDPLQCGDCKCTFPAPARRKPKLNADVPAKAKKPAPGKRSGFSQFLTENHESLLRWGKLAGLIVVALIVAAAMLQGIGKWGEKFEREADSTGLSFDLQSTIKAEIVAAAGRQGAPPSIAIESLEIDWDAEEDRVVPFVAVVSDFIDSRKRVTLRGELNRRTGKWYASAGGGRLSGTMTAADSNTRMFGVIVIVIIVLTVALVAKALLKQ